ncbi:MAG: cytochrome c [Granulosicoccus sp.]
MMKFSVSGKLLGLAIAGAMLGASVLAQADDGPHDKAIKARQAMFQLYGFNFGMLNAMAKGDMPYDADIAAEAANNLAAASSLGQSQMWPAGSDNETDGNARTRALPAIWNDFAGVSEKGKAMVTAVAALVPAAGDGLDALQGVIGDVGASCKGCHDDYRAKKK